MGRLSKQYGESEQYYSIWEKYRKKHQRNREKSRLWTVRRIHQSWVGHR